MRDGGVAQAVDGAARALDAQVAVHHHARARVLREGTRHGKPRQWEQQALGGWVGGCCFTALQDVQAAARLLLAPLRPLSARACTSDSVA